MRYYDQGSCYRVTCSEDDVDNFNEDWPGSSMNGPVSFTFAENGDLIDLHPDGLDGAEVLALSQDAKDYGEEKRAPKKKVNKKKANNKERIERAISAFETAIETAQDEIQGFEAQLKLLRKELSNA